jgi:hypothetical protein
MTSATTSFNVPDVLQGDTRKDFLRTNGRRCLLIGAYLMPMLTFRILGKTTATTESGLTVSDLFFFFSIVMLAASRHRRKLPPTRIWYVAVAFIVVGGILATFHADSPIESLFADARMIFVLLMWQWTIRHLIDDEHRMHMIMTAYVLGCVTSALVAILQLEAHVLVSLGTLYKGRATGLAKHPDDTGSLLALGLVFAVGLALHPLVRRWRLLYIGCAAVIGMGLICTGSVSGMITGAVGSIVAMVLCGISPKQIFTVAIVAVVAYVGATSIQGHSGKSLNPIARFEAATGPESGGSNSVSPRIGTWKGAWHGIVNSPILGHGLDVASGVTYTDPYNNVAEETHDFILMGWYQGGFLFLFGELLCIAEGIRRMFIGGRRHPTRSILFAGAVTVIAFALQAPMMFDRYFWFPFVLATAYPMLAMRNGNGNGNGTAPVGELAPLSA